MSHLAAQAFWGDVAQEVRAVVWQSEGCRFDPTLGMFEVSLSKIPNPQLLLTSWLVPFMAANRRWCVNVCEWVIGRHQLYSALDKGSPFTILKEAKDQPSNATINE